MIVNISKCNQDEIRPYLLSTLINWKVKFQEANPSNEETRDNKYWWEDILKNNCKEGSFIKNLTPTKNMESKNEIEKFNMAKKLFENKLPELLNDRKEQYACAIEGKIMIGTDEIDLIKKAINKFGSVSMYVGKIEEKTAPVNYNIRPELVIE